MCFQLPALLGGRGTPAENCSEKSPCTRVMGASTGASAPPPPSRCRRGAQKRQQNEKRRAPPAGASGPRGWREEIIGDRRGLHRCLLRRVTAPHSSRPATPRSCPEAASAAAERAAAPLVTAPAPLRVRPPSRPHSPLPAPLPLPVRLLSSVSAEAPRLSPATARLAAPGPAGSARLSPARRQAGSGETFVKKTFIYTSRQSTKYYTWSVSTPNLLYYET